MNGRCRFFSVIGVAMLAGCGAVDPNNPTGQTECPVGFWPNQGTCRNAVGCTPDLPFAWSDDECRAEPEPECERDWDCDDGLFCNGWEACAVGQCVAGDPPCEAGEVCDEDFRECSMPEVSTVDEILDASWLVAFQYDGSLYEVGSAFAIGGDLLGTNAHVVEGVAEWVRFGARAVVLHNETGNMLDVSMMWTHPEYNIETNSPDVGAIEVGGWMSTALTFANDTALRSLHVFDNVRLSGFPGELEGLNLVRPRATMLSGHVTALRPFDQSQATTPDTAMLIQHDMPTSPGVSGSPVVNDLGEVIAVHCSGSSVDADAENNFAIRADALTELLAWIDAGWVDSVDTTDPCEGVFCDDGLFCNGIETCDATTGDCVSYSSPCGADEECDEGTNECFIAGLVSDGSWRIIWDTQGWVDECYWVDLGVVTHGSTGCGEWVDIPDTEILYDDFGPFWAWLTEDGTMLIYAAQPAGEQQFFVDFLVDNEVIATGLMTRN